MDKRLDTIKKRLAEIRAAREAKKAELAAAEEARARAAAETEARAREAAAAAAKAEGKMTREEYTRSVEACQAIKEEARDDLRDFAATVLKSFYDARAEYLSIFEEVEGVLREIDTTGGIELTGYRAAGNSTPGGLFFGDPNAPGYRTGKIKLWHAVDGEFPDFTPRPEYIPPKRPETPTARSLEELEALKKLGLRRFGAVLPGPVVQTPEEWLNPSIEWHGGSVTEMKPGIDEVPARMDYEGRVQEGGTFGSEGRVIIPPKSEE